jgi:hypothetical protein
MMPLFNIRPDYSELVMNVVSLATVLIIGAVALISIAHTVLRKERKGFGVWLVGAFCIVVSFAQAFGLVWLVVSICNGGRVPHPTIYL